MRSDTPYERLHGVGNDLDPMACTYHGSFVPFGDKFTSEARMSGAVLAYLAQWFHVRKQVTGTHWSGKRLRIDAVLRPLDPGPWFDSNPVFGIEFKKTGYRSLNHYMRWIAQAVDYTETEWDGYGRMSVFTCPTITEDCLYLKNEANAFFVTRLLGQFRIGELGYTASAGWILRMTGEAYWSQYRGVYGPPKSLIPKVGSR